MNKDLGTTVSEQFPSIIEMLSNLIRIPSVSASGYPTQALRDSAEKVAALARQVGFSDVRLLEFDGAHPAVFGHIPAPEGAPTVLLYAHHDVQPPGPAEEWKTGPFEPFVEDGRLYGRGSSDDKGGLVMHLGAVKAFGGRPPVGVKLFVEGEEEVGSSHLGDLLDRYAELLEADVIVIGDSDNWRVGQPSLTTSLRGIVAVTVEVRTAEQACHSGQFGGPIPDALTVLSRLLSTLHTPEGEVAVAGLDSFDSDPLDLTEEELCGQVKTVPGLRMLGSGSLTSRLWSKPAIAVLAIDAPPLREAINQLVPVARAKVSMRIPPGQDTGLAMAALRRHLLDHIEWGAQLTVTGVEGGDAFRMEMTGPASHAWKMAMSETWGKPVVEMGVGGSIPFVAEFTSRFPDAEILLTGPGDPTSAAHAPNESQDLDDLQKSILAQAIALRLLA